MKFLLAFLIILFFYVSTNCNIDFLYPKVINVKSIKYKINGTLSNDHIYKFVIDGHEYFISSKGMIIHTANCTCNYSERGN